jgi:hypothetical protein
MVDPEPSDGLERGARIGGPGFRGLFRFGRCRGRLHGAVLSLLLLAILPLTGCGHGDHPPLGRVHGKVTLHGKPLPGALVVFHPPKGHISSDTTDADGNFDLIYLRDQHGAIVGKHRVEISTQPPEDFRKEIVPAKFNRNTTLEKEVSGSDNPIDFDLN